MSKVKRFASSIGRGLAFVGQIIAYPFVVLGRLLYRFFSGLTRKHLYWILPVVVLIGLLSFLGALYVGWDGSLVFWQKEEDEPALEQVVILEDEVVETIGQRQEEVDEKPSVGEPSAREEPVPVLVPPEAEEDPIPTFTLNDLMAPILGEIVTPYGWHFHPVFRDWRFHRGIDIKADPGTPVRAVWEGRVAEVREDEYFGTIVVVDHGHELQTVYGHLERVNLGAGSRVVRGESLGVIGLSDVINDPRLHFELHHRGLAIDPGPYYLGWRGGN